MLKKPYSKIMRKRALKSSTIFSRDVKGKSMEKINKDYEIIMNTVKQVNFAGNLISR
mgnify:CR=1 FL=1